MDEMGGVNVADTIGRFYKTSLKRIFVPSDKPCVLESLTRMQAIRRDRALYFPREWIQ